MRNVYLVCYDVCDPKRLRRTYRKMRGFGTPIQYSIFQCKLSPTERQTMKESLWEIMNWSQDRVVVVDLGPAEGQGRARIESWGEPRERSPEGPAVIV